MWWKCPEFILRCVMNWFFNYLINVGILPTFLYLMLSNFSAWPKWWDWSTLMECYSRHHARESNILAWESEHCKESTKVKVCGTYCSRWSPHTAEGKWWSGEAAAEQVNCIWLISGETVTLNFIKKSMPRMGLGRKVAVKSLPWNCTVFLMKPQEGIGCLSAPLRRGPDGLEFWQQGTMLSVPPVSTKYLSFVNSYVRKINPALAGKCIAMAVACVGLAAEPKMVQRQASFQTKHRAEHTCEPYGHNNCEVCICHCQGFERNKSLGWKGGDFWSGNYRSVCRLSTRC